ncbi:ankyrin repeat-containing domain protein [Podospora appendiculata]|uniref:Ankyrin repeat-containing domain protein n=1 Tax=Podospora appendiculata TaxID=314037 RepID=A0AAE0X032_9PEZI|nr:ankyrin repeat-containing domain protein [Podospora appendiculata]
MCAGQLDIFLLLRSRGAALLVSSWRDPIDLLHHAVSLQQWAIVEHLLSKPGPARRKDRVNRRDHHNQVTPFWIAYYNDDTDWMTFLAHEGADINAAWGEGFTPFFHACLTGRFDTAMVLIRLGADVSTRFRSSSHPIVAEFDWIQREDGRTDVEPPGPSPLVGCRPIDICHHFRLNDRSYGWGSRYDRDFPSHHERLADWVDDLEVYRGRLQRALLDAPGAELETSVSVSGDVDVDVDVVDGNPQDVVLLAARELLMSFLKIIIRHPKFRAYHAKHGTKGIFEAVRGTPIGFDPKWRAERVDEIETCLRSKGSRRFCHG